MFHTETNYFSYNFSYNFFSKTLEKVKTISMLRESAKSTLKNESYRDNLKEFSRELKNNLKIQI